MDLPSICWRKRERARKRNQVRRERELSKAVIATELNELHQSQTELDDSKSNTNTSRSLEPDPVEAETSLQPHTIAAE